MHSKALCADSWSQTVSCLGWEKERQFGEKRLQSKQALFLSAPLALTWFLKVYSTHNICCRVTHRVTHRDYPPARVFGDATFMSFRYQEVANSRRSQRSSVKWAQRKTCAFASSWCRAEDGEVFVLNYKQSHIFYCWHFEIPTQPLTETPHFSLTSI